MPFDESFLKVGNVDLNNKEVALERLVAALVEEKGGGVVDDMDDGMVGLEGAPTELNQQTCVFVGAKGDKKHPERLV